MQHFANHLCFFIDYHRLEILERSVVRVTGNILSQIQASALLPEVQVVLAAARRRLNPEGPGEFRYVICYLH